MDRKIPMPEIPCLGRKGEIFVPEWNCVPTVGCFENGLGVVGVLAGVVVFFVYEDPQHKRVWIVWGADIV